MIDISKIQNIQLEEPSRLNTSSEEENIYTETAQESQLDHKNAEALKLLQDKAREENHKLTIENGNLEKLAKHRITYSWWIFGFVVIFLTMVLLIVTLNGFQIMKLNDNVIDTLLATNMVQVVGILYIVAKWLYPQNNTNKTL